MDTSKTFNQKEKTITITIEKLQDKINDSKTRIKENEKSIRVLQAQISRHMNIIKQEEELIAAKKEEIKSFKQSYEGLL